MSSRKGSDSIRRGRNRSRSRSQSSDSSSDSNSSSSSSSSSSTSSDSSSDQRRRDRHQRRHAGGTGSSSVGGRGKFEVDRRTELLPELDEEKIMLDIPPPPTISNKRPPARPSFSLSGPKPKPVSGIQLKLAAPKAKEQPKLPVKVASAFANDDSDEEPEEMPAEARMRMRNIGRDTPTSSGPNSFGKTKQGFCDSKKIFEKALKNLVAD